MDDYLDKFQISFNGAKLAAAMSGKEITKERFIMIIDTCVNMVLDTEEVKKRKITTKKRKEK